jgi:hypothetical protein
MTAPFLELGAAYHALKPDIDAAVAQMLNSGWHVGGPEVTALKRRMRLRQAQRIASGWRTVSTRYTWRSS